MFCFLISPAFAQIEGAKDSIDYMEDGEMTIEEMQQEADFVGQECEITPGNPVYYDCECVAANFFQIREREGPFVLKQDIVPQAYERCPNTAGVAGMYYGHCVYMRGITNPSDTKKEAEDYCACVSNTLARAYGENPSTRNQYLQSLYVNAVQECRARFSP